MEGYNSRARPRLTFMIRSVIRKTEGEINRRTSKYEKIALHTYTHADSLYEKLRKQKRYTHTIMVLALDPLLAHMAKVLNL